MKSTTPFNIDFMGGRKVFAGLSLAYILFSILYISVFGMNFGLDFTGGTLVEVQMPVAADPDEVRSLLDESGLRDGMVQLLGSEREVLVRMPPQVDIDQASLGDRIVETLRVKYGDVVLKQSSFVGPVVGNELREDGALAMLAALAAIMVYVMLRFTRQFAIASIVALIHDVIAVLGCFAIFGWTFDLSVLAAVLAIIGYSINDSIVIADRIRENFRNMRRATPLEIVNKSLNQVLERTLITSGTVLLTLIALLLVGGDSLRGFSLAMTIGVFFGCYSSIFVLAAMVIFMNVTREDLVAPVDEEKRLEEGPL